MYMFFTADDISSQDNLPEEKPRQICGLGLPGTEYWLVCFSLFCKGFFALPFFSFPLLLGSRGSCYNMIEEFLCRWCWTIPENVEFCCSEVHHSLQINVFLFSQRRSYRELLLVLIYLIPRRLLSSLCASFFLLFSISTQLIELRLTLIQVYIPSDTRRFCTYFSTWWDWETCLDFSIKWRW